MELVQNLFGQVEKSIVLARSMNVPDSHISSNHRENITSWMGKFRVIGKKRMYLYGRYGRFGD